MDFGRLLADPIMEDTVGYQKYSMFYFLSVWKTRRRYVKSGRLLAHRILQQIGSERSDSIREMHFWTFSVFLCFQT